MHPIVLGFCPDSGMPEWSVMNTLLMGWLVSVNKCPGGRSDSWINMLSCRGCQICGQAKVCRAACFMKVYSYTLEHFQDNKLCRSYEGVFCAPPVCSNGPPRGQLFRGMGYWAGKEIDFMLWTYWANLSYWVVCICNWFIQQELVAGSNGPASRINACLIEKYMQEPVHCSPRHAETQLLTFCSLL